MGANNAAALNRFRAIADRVRRVPEAHGQRPTQTTIRVRTYSSAVGAQGTTLATTTDTVLDPRPKVVQVTDGQRSYFGGGTVSLSNGLLVAAVYEVGPITQEFPGGGYAQDDVAPPSGYTKRVTVVLEGPEFTTGGEEFAVDAADFTRPQRGMLRVVRARQGA